MVISRRKKSKCLRGEYYEFARGVGFFTWFGINCY